MILPPTEPGTYDVTIASARRQLKLEGIAKDMFGSIDEGLRDPSLRRLPDGCGKQAVLESIGAMAFPSTGLEGNEGENTPGQLLVTGDILIVVPYAKFGAGFGRRCGFGSGEAPDC